MTAKKKKLDPWDRRENESFKAYEAFKVYRDMGMDRNQVKTAAQLGKSTSLIEQWSVKYEWVIRVDDWDRMLDDEYQKALVKRRKEMCERHANQAMIFQNRMLQRLQSMRADELSPSDCIKFFEIAVKVERLSLGETTENVENKTTVIQVGLVD